MHAMMAFTAADRSPAATKRIAAMEAEANSNSTNAMMTRQVGLPIARGVEAFGRKRYAEAVDYLMPVRYRAHIFGGSHAQRDIVHRTLIEAALRDDDSALAGALINERTSLRPQCPYSWQLHERAGTAS